MEEKQKNVEYIGNNVRWAKTTFASLDKIVELMKKTDFTKEDAETALILANVARRLESTE